MSKQKPYIWLQEHEYAGKADCGCELRNQAKGPALWLCPMHSAAQDLLRVVKRMNVWVKKTKMAGSEGISKKAEKIIAKAERRQHAV